MRSGHAVWIGGVARRGRVSEVIDASVVRVEVVVFHVGQVSAGRSRCVRFRAAKYKGRRRSFNWVPKWNFPDNRIVFQLTTFLARSY